jgi:hypothetical protein
MNFNHSQHIYRAIYLGLLITLIQILFACLLSGANDPVEAYTKLCYWDCAWYGKIVENGYQSTIPPVGQNPDLANVAFFPGYPIIARAFKNFFGLPTHYSLIVVAQLACWGFWTYLFLFFQRWRISVKLAIGGVIAVLMHPAAFFLVAGYSESLFLMALLGFLYWSKSPRFSSWILAALHGFVMTATRIVGLPLVLYPLFHFWTLSAASRSGNFNQQLQKNSRYLLLWGISSLGGILFFIFCYLKFGYWNLYMQTQLIGWGVKPDYLAILNPKSYLTFIQAQGLSTFISSISVPATMVLFLICFLMEWKATQLLKKKSWQQRAEFYFCGWIIFYISVAACSSVWMKSMSRYTFCVYVMLVLAIIHLISKVQPFKTIAKNWVAFLLLFLATASFLIQSKLVHNYTNSLWVA